MMKSRFKTGVYFLIGADSNDLKLDDILNLSPKLKQVVNKPTHHDKILDPIITDLHTFYQDPTIEEPLDADTDAGEASDHKMVLMVPLNTVDNLSILSFEPELIGCNISILLFDVDFVKVGNLMDIEHVPLA